MIHPFVTSSNYKYTHCSKKFLRITNVKQNIYNQKCIRKQKKKTSYSNQRLQYQKPEKGYNCRNCDFAEAAVFRYLRDEIQLFGFCFKKK